jgi:hypothetical protein
MSAFCISAASQEAASAADHAYEHRQRDANGSHHGTATRKQAASAIGLR